MKRNTDLIAGLMVVLTLFGVTNLPKKGSEGQPTTESTNPTSPPAKKEAGSETEAYSPCKEIANRLRRFVRVTDEKDNKAKKDGARVEDWKLPDSCYETHKASDVLLAVETLPDVHFAIATVPNPVSTHLPLLFDRFVDTIQQAAQDDSYSYDSSWFPWDVPRKDYTFLTDQQAAEALQDIQKTQPGVMVFRRGLQTENDSPPYESGLVIFLVAEQPTGGIDDAEFDNALDWIDKFGGFAHENTLPVLGPTFSGSLPSLQRILGRHLTSGMTKPYIGNFSIQVSSGSVSSGLSYRWFRNWLESYHGTFRTAMENDDLMVERFCRYLSSQGYPLERVAFLSEDQTAFGGEKPDKDSGGSIYLYYPRDIATLRSAYEQQSIFSSAKPQSNANAPSTTLRGDLSEPAGGEHDTVRSYGGQLTPLAQESILLDITNRLNEKQIQFIILRGTSSLDQIFLSEFLRRSYPEGRVVIDGADLLFSRGAEGKSLRGVMLLSTYPLVTWQQDWTSSLLNGNNGSYRTFGEDVSEGVYIVARELFRDPGSPRGNEVPIHDYAPPAWAVDPQGNTEDNQRPATWITVISHRQFWPVAVLNSNTLKRSKVTDMLPPSRARGDGPPLSDGAPHREHFPLAMWMLLVAGGAWGAIHFWSCWKGSITGRSRARAYFAPVPRWQHPALIALGSMLLALLAFVVAAASGLLSWPVGINLFRPFPTGSLLAGWVLVVLAASFFAACGNYKLPTMYAEDPENNEIKRWQHNAGVAATIVFIAFELMQIRFVLGLNQANSVPTYWRSVNLLSGVSALLPQVLLIAGAYLWFWFSLRGLAHFGEDRPLLPTLDDLPKLDDPARTPRMPMFSQERAAGPVEKAAFPLTARYVGTLGTLLLLIIVVGTIALHDWCLRTLGERAFGVAIFFWVCIYIAVILADGIQLWRAWSELRQLLIYLDRMPLRRTLRALNGLAWGSIWKMSGNVLEERYRVITLQFESLRCLGNTMAAWAPDHPAARQRQEEVLKKVEACQQTGGKFGKWFLALEKDKPVDNLTNIRDFQKALASTAGLVMGNVLIPAWQTETDSLIIGRSKRDGKEGEEGETEFAFPIEKLPPHVRAAEEFFVLPYLGFIQNILGRIRTIVLGIVLLFVCTTLAISSYPFDPLNVLGGIFLTVFVLVGGATVLVYSQMSRDATLSHITKTRPGVLGLDFWMRLMAFGIAPLLGLLTTLFPSITDFVFSWLQPGVQALK